MADNVARIVNLSGGKDSTAMLLWLLEKGEPFDAVIYMDTGWDFPEMAEHLEQLESYTGVKIERVHHKYTFDYMLMERPRTKGRLKGMKGAGFCTPRNRWCTRRKLEAIRLWTQEHFPMQHVCHYIGLASDEAHRMRRNDLEAGTVRYPLIEWQKTEEECLRYCKSLGFHWGGGHTTSSGGSHAGAVRCNQRQHSRSCGRTILTSGHG